MVCVCEMVQARRHNLEAVRELLAMSGIDAQKQNQEGQGLHSFTYAEKTIFLSFGAQSAASTASRGWDARN